MCNQKPHILIISSVNPLVGPGRMPWDCYQAFHKEGFKIDFLTKYKVEEHPEIFYIYKKHSLVRKVKQKIRSLFSKRPIAGYFFFRFLEREYKPLVSPKLVIEKIKKDYDLVLIYFCHGLVSHSLIEKIYDKLHCQIHIRCVDYFFMSGGCYFPMDCERYKLGCGLCPARKSNNPDDYTHQNVLYRKRIIDKIKPIFYANTYMQDKYRQSFLTKDSYMVKSFPIINEEDFIPQDKIQLRKEYQISSQKKFLIFFGCQSLIDTRKGMPYLIEALQFFSKSINLAEQKSILLVIAGADADKITHYLPFDFLNLGFVDISHLSKLFALSDVYLSPSVVDAGPMMVNQALSCGIPVVSFEIGTAIDVIKDRGTGYCAKNKDSADFAKGIETIFRLNKIEHKVMSEKCRNIAIKTTSCKSYIYQIIDVFNKMQTI